MSARQIIHYDAKDSSNGGLLQVLKYSEPGMETGKRLS